MLLIEQSRLSKHFLARELPAMAETALRERRCNRGQRLFTGPGNALQMTGFVETGVAFPGQSTNTSEIVSSIQRPSQDNSARRDRTSCQEREAGRANRFEPQVCGVVGSGARPPIAGRQQKRKISKSTADEVEPWCGPAV